MSLVQTADQELQEGQAQAEIALSIVQVPAYRPAEARVMYSQVSAQGQAATVFPVYLQHREVREIPIREIRLRTVQGRRAVQAVQEQVQVMCSQVSAQGQAGIPM